MNSFTNKIILFLKPCPFFLAYGSQLSPSQPRPPPMITGIWVRGIPTPEVASKCVPTTPSPTLLFEVRVSLHFRKPDSHILNANKKSKGLKWGEAWFYPLCQKILWLTKGFPTASVQTSSFLSVFSVWSNAHKFNIPGVCWALNSSYHPTCGLSPFRLQENIWSKLDRNQRGHGGSEQQSRSGPTRAGRCWGAERGTRVPPALSAPVHRSFLLLCPRDPRSEVTLPGFTPPELDWRGARQPWEGKGGREGRNRGARSQGRGGRGRRSSLFSHAASQGRRHRPWSLCLLSGGTRLLRKYRLLKEFTT